MISQNEIQRLLLCDLKTDRVSDDVTTKLLGPDAERKCRVLIVSKETGVFCGQAVLESFEFLGLESKKDGDQVKRGETAASYSCTIGRVLTSERTLLNAVTHLSGVATLTRKFVDAVKPFPVKILATRKTLPGLRDLQLMGVVAGGGHVHRRSLSDGILIKDNHIAIGGAIPLLKRAEETRSPLHRVEIEVQNLEQLDEVLSVGADVIMLDNFDHAMLREGIKRVRERASDRTKIEVSGGVSLESVRAIAELGVDYISVGMLTHSVTALNMSLDLK